jgi:hypothetical protein
VSGQNSWNINTNLPSRMFAGATENMHLIIFLFVLDSVHAIYYIHVMSHCDLGMCWRGRFEHLWFFICEHWCWSLTKLNSTHIIGENKNFTLNTVLIVRNQWDLNGPDARLIIKSSLFCNKKLRNRWNSYINIIYDFLSMMSTVKQ